MLKVYGVYSILIDYKWLEVNMMDNLSKITVSALSRVCGVKESECWEWKNDGVVPEEYIELVNSISVFTLDEVAGTVLRIEESDKLWLLYTAAKKRDRWELSNNDALSRCIGSETPKTSLKELLETKVLEKYNKDILWAYTQLSYKYKKPILTIKYPDNSSLKVEIDLDLSNIISSSLRDTPKATKDFYRILSEILTNIILEAEEEEGRDRIRDILDMADLDPEEVFVKQLNKIASEWCSKHITGTIDEDDNYLNPEPIHTVLDGRRYVGGILFTPTTFGSYFREVCEDTEDDTIIYTGQGFLQGFSFLENIERDGIGRLVPLFPAHMRVGVYEAYRWLLPNAIPLVKEAIKASGVIRSTSDALTELQEALSNKIKSVVSTSQSTPMEQPAGVTYLDDKSITLAKINKEAFTCFNEYKPSNPFKVFTAHFGGGVDTFWAMLYSSLIPTQAVRKQALLLFGSGGSFKSTFMEKIFGRLLASTIRRTTTGQYKFSYTPGVSDVLARTKSEDAMKAETFGEINTPSNVVLWQEELSNFNIEWSSYKNLKKQLGTSQLTINVKYARNRKTLPVSRTVVLDSNYPPSSFIWNKESCDRCAETVLFSQYALVPPSKIYNTSSDNSHLYFQKLLTKEEFAEMRIVTECDQNPSEEDFLNYLAFLLFRDIMIIGKGAYEKLTCSPVYGLPTMLPFNPIMYDRKMLAMSYCKLIQLDRVSSSIKEASVTPITVLMYFLRAGLCYSKGSFIAWEKLEEILSSCTTSIKESLDLKNSSKKEFLSYVNDKLLRGSWLANSNISRFIGNEMLIDSNIPGESSGIIFSDEAGVYGLKIEDWFLELSDDVEVVKSRALLSKLQAKIDSILQEDYINRMEAINAKRLIPLRGISEGW